jgi:hypothetical protein
MVCLYLAKTESIEKLKKNLLTGNENEGSEDEESEDDAGY